MFTSNLNILYNLNLHLVPNYNKLELFDEEESQIFGYKIVLIT